jgi:hypothetical protein
MRTHSSVCMHAPGGFGGSHQQKKRICRIKRGHMQLKPNLAVGHCCPRNTIGQPESINKMRKVSPQGPLGGEEVTP